MHQQANLKSEGKSEKADYNDKEQCGHTLQNVQTMNDQFPL